MLRDIPRTPVQVAVFALTGGLDLHTPMSAVQPGVARGTTYNFEVATTGGYTRIAGYERFDGRVSPSLASYQAYPVAFTSTPAVGASINGQTSGATAVVAKIDGGTLVMTKVAGTFVAGENLRVGTTAFGVLSSLTPPSINDTKAAEYLLAAMNRYRADIAAVPGSGPILGVFAFGGDVYAWRNNAGATQALLYKSSVAGWVAIPFKYEVAFTAGGGTPPAEGATVTKGTVSAVVRRVVLQSGAWSSNTAAGRLIIEAPTGGSFSAGAFTAGITATCSGPQTAISFLPGGQFEFHVSDCGNGRRVYGCDGANRGWEFDGTYVVPIVTGMGEDKPEHLIVHKKHLFFSFKHSVQHSGLGTPYSWQPLLGAAEMSMGDQVTGFLPMPGSQSGGALAITTVRSMSMLYGNSSADWQALPVDQDDGSGAYSRTARYIGQGLVFNDRGVVSLTASQNYGNFDSAALTSRIRQYVQAHRANTTCAVLNRERSQYRVFFSDGAGLYATLLNGEFLGAMPVQFDHPVMCAWNEPGSTEETYFGSTDGFVYRMDVGSSFDGNAIPFTLELAYADQGGSRVRKRYRRCSLEMQGSGYAEFDFGYTLSYGSEDADQPVLHTVASSTKPAYWDAFTWDAFTWDGRQVAPTEIEMEGTGESVSIALSGQSALWPSFTVNSVTLHYSTRRLTRGS
ncbi:MAG: hypothetical protein HY856_13635 [Burkholderiales bacterium]|nr:hypothetical protein [Burkholderiales bacterium]